MVLVMIFITLTSSLSFFPVSVYLPIYVQGLADPFTSELVLGIFNLAAVGALRSRLVSQIVGFC